MALRATAEYAELPDGFQTHKLCSVLSARLQLEPSAYSGVPSMTLDLEVQVLWGVDRSDPS
jgi:hypothetical protein